jgi:hypothetical protein
MRTRIVVLYADLARTPVGETVEIDAKIRSEPDDEDNGEAGSLQLGSVEICRESLREISIGQWRPRE